MVEFVRHRRWVCVRTILATYSTHRQRYIVFKLMDDVHSPHVPPCDWRILDKVVICRASPGSISDHLWGSFMDEVRQSSAKTFFAMVVGDVSISSSQRRLVAQVMERNRMSAIAVTDSRIVRGMMTAISWLGPKLFSYSWRDFDQALRHLNPSPHVEREIRMQMRSLLNFRAPLKRESR